MADQDVLRAISLVEDYVGRREENPSPTPFSKSIPEAEMRNHRANASKEFRALSSMDFSETLPVGCEHSSSPFEAAVLPKSMGYGPSADRSLADPSEPDVVPAPIPTLDVDLGSGSSPSHTGEPARGISRIPPRIADRPLIEEWIDDELMTLPEAASLFWPAGPITTNTLRTAARDGTLIITKVAGKHFTTPMAIRRMGVAAASGAAQIKGNDAVTASAEALFQMKLAEAKRLGGGRALSRRAAKRPVMPAIGDRAGG